MIKSLFISGFLIVTGSLFLTSVKGFPVSLDKREIQENAEDLSEIGEIDYECSERPSSELKSNVGRIIHYCAGKDEDMEYWRMFCKCVLDANQECPPCSDSESNPHNTTKITPFSTPFKLLDSNSFMKTFNGQIAPRSANLISSKSVWEPENHAKIILKHTNSTNFIRFG